MEEDLCTAEFSFPFKSAKEAEIAYNTLRVDKEPVRGGATKALSLESNHLKVVIKAKEARLLRISVNSFMDFLNLVVQTIERFGPPVIDNGGK